MVDEGTRKTLSSIPLLQTRAGPRDKDIWVQRLKEEYQALIKVNALFDRKVKVKLFALFSLKYVQNNKEAGNDWFRLESNKEGTKWFGKCWCMHNMLKYEFDVEFDVRVKSPVSFYNVYLTFSILPDSCNLSGHGAGNCSARVGR